MSGGNPAHEVHNVNFPFPVGADTLWETTIPARFHPGSLYRKAGEDLFRFRFALPREDPRTVLTDIACLKQGRISHSVLEFGRLGVPERIQPASDA